MRQSLFINQKVIHIL